MTKTCTVRVDPNTGSTYYLSTGATRSRKEWKTFAGALRAAKARGWACETTVDPMIEYKRNEGKTKIVTSLMTGKLVRIGVNTPACCDPSREAYWSK